MYDEIETSEDLEAAERFKEDMELINRARNESAAVTLDKVGTNQGPAYANYVAGQKAQAAPLTAQRGVALGVSSGRSGLNVLAINANTTRQAWAAREQAKPCVRGRICRRRRAGQRKG
jgi:hypothetical protein